VEFQRQHPTTSRNVTDDPPGMARLWKEAERVKLVKMRKKSEKCLKSIHKIQFFFPRIFMKKREKNQ
jgi:hypothetical protein